NSLPELISTILHAVPSARRTFLSSLGKRVHASAARILFHTLTLEDDDCLVTASDFRSPLGPVLSRPQFYALHIKKIALQANHAFSDCASPLPEYGHANADPLPCSPVTAEHLELILTVCCNLEEMEWNSPICPPDGFCEVCSTPTSQCFVPRTHIAFQLLATHSPRLHTFSYYPHHVPFVPRKLLRKWDAPSLPLLKSLPLTTLRLSSLSQIGSKAFTQLLQSYDESSSLEDLCLDLVWLDDTLCEAVAENTWRLRTLRVSTSGTKLTDKGLLAILSGCDALEYFALDEVQGRLSRGLWSKTEIFPPALKSFVITVSETGPCHSWSTDHFHSLEDLPFDSLTEFSVVRKEAPPYTNDILSHEPSMDDAVALRPLPEQIKSLVAARTLLTTLRCDFWMCSVSDIKTVLESCSKLEVTLIKNSSATPWLGMASSFAALSNLTVIRVSINPKHAPGNPPIPLPPHSYHQLPTPISSPVIKTKALLPQLVSLDHVQSSQLSVTIPEDTDPSMPLLRDVKRFIRRCSRLRSLEWIGKYSRGSWAAHRPTKCSKTGANVSVEYRPPTSNHDTWTSIQANESHTNRAGMLWANVERPGHSWVGESAETLKALYNKQCSERTPPKRTSKQNGTKYSRTATTDQILDSPSLTLDVEPVSPSSPVTPLTPPHSDTSYDAEMSPVDKHCLSSSATLSSSFTRRGQGRKRSATTSARGNEGEKNVGNRRGQVKHGRRTTSMSVMKANVSGKPDRERKRVLTSAL
ncbi:hypothetical protein BDZ89DRAFT_939943, partial [Hymenopellis radicata]